MHQNSVSKAMHNQQQQLPPSSLSLEATVNPGLKSSVLRWAFSLMIIWYSPVCIFMNFKSWIKLIYDKITEIHRVKNELNSTCKVQGYGEGILQNSH